ncbi:alanine racemase [Desulfobacula phenolica]|uniref:Alanine racemase n=1 Tax=Desulfobacula phenolica TaxID=90732 RepID=A0A1H2K0K9_9BACT|nr:alanine racemase [Desulfobacula phenolica]SDU62093.1 alanine racemase [Desulfobacula phenolica]
MEYPLVKACIDLDAIQHNVQHLKQMIPGQSKFMAVVKANAYGHGAIRVAQKALKSGADWLGIARLNEAVELRKAGIQAPILMFGYIHPSQVRVAVDLDLVITVYEFEMAQQLSREARRSNKYVKAHLKVDTGMGRVGMIIDKPDKNPSCQTAEKQREIKQSARKKAVKEIKKILRLPGIDLNGIYTHFAAADSKDKTYTQMQIDLFTSLLEDLRKEAVDLEVCHAANSAGIIRFARSHFDMVRAGISLYGLYPSFEVDQSKVALVPAMSLTSIVTAVRNVPKGFYVSYGRTHKTQKPTRLASIPVGYADGFSRLFSSNGTMLVKGYKAPIVGRVCMDQTMIDVGDIPDVKTGDEVVLIGSQGNKTISADELAKKINTINYEIVSALTSRVERIYSDSGSVSG